MDRFDLLDEYCSVIMPTSPKRKTPEACEEFAASYPELGVRNRKPKLLAAVPVTLAALFLVVIKLLGAKIHP
jgi:hypothetical protein